MNYEDSFKQVRRQQVYEKVFENASLRKLVLDALLLSGTSDSDISYRNAKLKMLEDDVYGLLLRQNNFYKAKLDCVSDSDCEYYIDSSRPFYIYICTFDPFGKGLPIYSFNSKTYFNITADLSTLPDSTQNMLEYFNNGRVSDYATMAIDEAYREVLENSLQIDKQIFRFESYY